MAAMHDLEFKKISSVTAINAAETNNSMNTGDNIDRLTSRRNQFANKVNIQVDSMGNEAEDDSAEVDIR